MQEWIISANPNVYKHADSFDDYGFIDWKQGRIKYSVGDIVFIYCSKPISSVQYKCIVERIDLTYAEIRNDEDYWINQNDYEKSLQGQFIRLKLIEYISDKKMTLKELLNNGLNAAPQNPTKVVPSLSKYLNENFTNQHMDDYFPDQLNDDPSIYEGLRKAVSVNRYERSSVARDECIKYHGLNCFVCGVLLSDIYGEIGEGFIHVHHIVPISKIGKKYKIDFRCDLIPVCPNCHAMLHRKKKNGERITVEELKEELKNRIVYLFYL